MKKTLVGGMLILFLIAISNLALGREEAVLRVVDPTPSSGEENENAPTDSETYDEAEDVKSALSTTDANNNNDIRLKDVSDGTVVIHSQSSLEEFRVNGDKYYIKYVGKNLLGGYIIRVATTDNEKDQELTAKTVVLKSSPDGSGKFKLSEYDIKYSIIEQNRISARIYLSKSN